MCELGSQPCHLPAVRLGAVACPEAPPPPLEMGVTGLLALEAAPKKTVPQMDVLNASF